MSEVIHGRSETFMIAFVVAQPLPIVTREKMVAGFAR
jgi:hypothetical protein